MLCSCPDREVALQGALAGAEQRRAVVRLGPHGLGGTPAGDPPCRGPACTHGAVPAATPPCADCETASDGLFCSASRGPGVRIVEKKDRSVGGGTKHERLKHPRPPGLVCSAGFPVRGRRRPHKGVAGLSATRGAGGHPLPDPARPGKAQQRDPPAIWVPTDAWMMPVCPFLCDQCPSVLAARPGRGQALLCLCLAGPLGEALGTPDRWR